VITTSAPSAASAARLSTDIFSGITHTRPYPRAAATSASPTPVLPAVASISVAPGRRTPRASASRTIATRDPILHAPARVHVLALHEHRHREPAADALEWNERRLADVIEDRHRPSMLRNEPMFSLGVGLTNACNLSCAHCYRATGTDALDIDAVLAATEAVPTRAVNFGTGENALHPRFADLVQALVDRGIAVTMTTNGHSAAALPDDLLARFRDVELSIDFPTREAHDEARGPGNWDLIAAQMERCERLGVSTTLVSVLMSTNARAMPELVRLAGERRSLLRVNVYQSVRGDAFALGYTEYWDAIRALLASADLVACGEPIVRAVLGLPRAPGEGCGVETIRITPRGAVVPCVYGADGALSLGDLDAMGAKVVDHETFARLRTIPEQCRACPEVETCRGGCASRRVLGAGLGHADAYCPFVRNESIAIPFTLASLGRALPKASSACTIIVRPRSGPGSGARPRRSDR